MSIILYDDDKVISMMSSGDIREKRFLRLDNVCKKKLFFLFKIL